MGAAPVDFVLVSLLVLPLFVAILQIGLALYVRNTMAACAHDGARYAASWEIVALGDESVRRSAVDHAANCIAQSLSGRFARDVVANTEYRTEDGGAALPVVEVRASTDVPLVGFLGRGPRMIRVTGLALEERW
ncbi:MAG: pilus assembly protein [Acidothermus sp.]|nr:pilus assembly protein [Acidothermus sp.]